MLLFYFRDSRALDLLKAYIHGHYRISKKTGKRVWIDSYSDKRPERGRTEFAHWQHRQGHFEHHLAHGQAREAMHAFHDLGDADSHKLARDLGLIGADEQHADKKTLMEAVHARVKARGSELADKVAGQVRRDWERRQATGMVGKRRKIQIHDPGGYMKDKSSEPTLEQQHESVLSPVNGKDLTLPETYSEDDVLASLARKLAKEKYDELGRGRVGIGELKQEFLDGKHAAVVSDALKPKAKGAKKILEGKKSAESIDAPPGYSIQAFGNNIRLKGDFDQDLHDRIKRIGGGWDGASGSNTRSWIIPAEKAESLRRIFSTWVPVHAERMAQRKANIDKKNRADAERWLGYVEEKSSNYIYQNGVDKLKEMNIGQWPDLLVRLNSAIAHAQSSEEKKRMDDHVRGVVESYSDYSETKPKMRRLYPVGKIPKLNVPVNIDGDVVVFTGYGKPFRISDEHPSVEGSHLLGYEGSQGRYAYYRMATKEDKK